MVFGYENFLDLGDKFPFDIQYKNGYQFNDVWTDIDDYYHILNNATLYIISGFGVQTVATNLKITDLLTDILIQGVFIAVTAFLARKINGKTTVE